MQQSEASFLDIFLSQLPIFLIFLVLYYFILRPNSKKQESVKLMQENLAKGDRVVTIGGIHGRTRKTVAGNHWRRSQARGLIQNA